MMVCERVVGYKAGLNGQRPSRAVRPAAVMSSAVGMAQAIARSRLQDYVSTPLIRRLQPTSAAAAAAGSTEDHQRATGSSHAVGGPAGDPGCYEKKLLIAPPRSDGRTTSCLSGCKSVDNSNNNDSVIFFIPWDLELSTGVKK